MDEFNLIGKQTISDYSFNGIEGGFGKGQRAILARDIAKIHHLKVYHVNLRIKEHRSQFIDGIDIVDLKDNKFAIRLTDSGILSQNALNASKHVYILFTLVTPKGQTYFTRKIKDAFKSGELKNSKIGEILIREHLANKRYFG